ncbi:MAG: Alpha/beta hydrolase fold-3 domain protein [Firmicutes bacterium]|nr:Alpha/beta hydrolase fold-3 domain protein [Bacillota bacterium]
MPSKEFLNRPGSIWERYKFEGKSQDVIRREMEEQLLEAYLAPTGVSWETGECGGISGKWIVPSQENSSVFLYIHGGGFTLGSSGIPLPFLCQLAARLKLRCFSVDYRLAPENPFPAGLEDCLAAYEGLLARGYSPEQIAVGGESAGATLSLALVHQLKATGRPIPKAVIAISPVVDATPKQSEASQFGKVLDSLPGIEEIMAVYAPGADLSDPRISPIKGDFTDFPALFVIAGGAEALCSESLELADVCSRAGGDVKLLVGRDMIHTYPLDFADYPEAAEAFEEIVLFLRNKLKQKL